MRRGLGAGAAFPGEWLGCRSPWQWPGVLLTLGPNWACTQVTLTPIPAHPASSEAPGLPGGSHCNPRAGGGVGGRRGGRRRSGWDAVWAEAWGCNGEQSTSSEELCMSGVDIYRNPPGQMHHSFPSPRFHPFALSPEHSKAAPTRLPHSGPGAALSAGPSQTVGGQAVSGGAGPGRGSRATEAMPPRLGEPPSQA